MDLIRRISTRSGRLVYIPEVDEFERPEPRFRWLEEILGLDVYGLSLADIGCWTGAGVQWAVKAGASQIHAVDIPGPWLSRLKEKMPQVNVHAVNNLQELASELNEQVDILLCLETIEHLPRGSDLDGINNIRSVILEGGTAIFSVPSAGLAALLDPAWLLFGHRHYRRKTFNSMLQCSRFQVITVQYSGNLWSSLDAVAMYFTKHILRRKYDRNWLTIKGETGLRSKHGLCATCIWIKATAI